MTRRIQEDHKMFRDVVGGTTRKELKEWIKTGRIIRKRGKNGTVSIPIPRIDLPHFIYGKPEEGVAGGPGKPGDVVGGEDPKKPGQGGASDDAGDAIEVNIDMEEVLKHMQEDWKLPNMDPKPNETFEDIKIKYNSLSKVGPSSLLHKRKTLLQTMRRMCAAGELSEENKTILPGDSVASTALLPTSEDMRYRQWNEVKIPSSNAVIFFARDISGSMDTFKCEVVSDMSWWIDLWIRQFYRKTERVYVVHDTVAKEVSEDKFYKLRMGGGTMCSTSMEYIAKQLKHRYPPSMWNVYIFYFTDGDNWMDDNAKFTKIIQDKLGPNQVKLIGLTQILPSSEQGVKEYVDKKISRGELDNKYIRTAGIDRNDKDKKQGWGWYYYQESMDEADRNLAIRSAIRDLLSAGEAQGQKVAAA